jgi:molybdate transport system substrate-binding protein
VRRLALGAGAALALALAGCGSDSKGASPIKVSAATSLKRTFEACSPGTRFSFGGSDELAAQIRQGGKPDVFAAANTKLPNALRAEGRLSKPTVFASNELVLAVPKGSPITSLAGVVKPGTALVIGQKTVPVGSYTHKVLDKLPAAQREAILKNVRSEEPDVGGVVAKLTQGAAQAGFVYVTDVAASGGKLVAIHLDRALKPFGDYGIGAVQGAPHPDAAKRFVQDVVSGRCHDALVRANFGAPGAGG